MGTKHPATLWEARATWGQSRRRWSRQAGKGNIQRWGFGVPELTGGLGGGASSGACRVRCRQYVRAGDVAAAVRAAGWSNRCKAVARRPCEMVAGLLVVVEAWVFCTKEG